MWEFGISAKWVDGIPEQQFLAKISLIIYVCGKGIGVLFFGTKPPVFGTKAAEIGIVKDLY